jgi:hypothetical protein
MLEGEISEESKKSKKSSRLKYVSTYQELFNFKEKFRTSRKGTKSSERVANAEDTSTIKS